MKILNPLFRRSRSVTVACGLAGLLLTLGACGGAGNSSSDDGVKGPSGDPVSGGVLTMSTSDSPRGLAPTSMINVSALSAALGNALYGALVTNDPATLEVEPSLAEIFESSDGGTSWTLKLNEGLEFSDGTPLTAEAVKLNWEGHADPVNGAADMSTASLIKSYNVVDDTTLKFTLVEPVPAFSATMASLSMNWIASPTALAKGPESFDENPIGAGPFTLRKWARGSQIELERNENYYNDPLPYLDGVVIRTIQDPVQSVDSLIAGDLDLVLPFSAVNLDKAKQAGMQIVEHSISGGDNLMFNTQKPPFDDPRARDALVRAVDLEALNVTAEQGLGEVMTTFFHEGDPLYSDVPLQEFDPKGAQALFDELADEGKPLEFTISTYKDGLAEAVQTQLAGYDNVKVEVERVDSGQVTAQIMSGSYDVMVSAVQVVVPDLTMRTWLHKDSAFHVGVLQDDEMSTMVYEAGTISDPEERIEAWRQIQERMAELDPFLFITRPVLSMAAGTNVGDVQLFGSGAVEMDRIWLQQ